MVHHSYSDLALHTARAGVNLRDHSIHCPRRQFFKLLLVRYLMMALSLWQQGGFFPNLHLTDAKMAD